MFDTSTPLETPQYAEEDHPKIPKQKIGILVANLGTPDNYDYWSMRRYLNEFLSDRRVIDYSPFLWQPLLQLLILTSRPFRSGAAYKSIWNEAESESPLMTITKAQTAAIKRVMHEKYGDSVAAVYSICYPIIYIIILDASSDRIGSTSIFIFPPFPHYPVAPTTCVNSSFFWAPLTGEW